MFEKSQDEIKMLDAAAQDQLKRYHTQENNYQLCDVERR